jgi:hypothetical protein
MSSRTFALLFGIVFLAVGVCGFIPGLSSPLHPEHPHVQFNGVQLLGLFPVNLLHNVVHVLFGLWGLMASRSLGGSVLYARGVALVYAVLTIAGMLAPPLSNFFELVPLYGNDVWLHGLIAVVAAYFRWVTRNPAAA